MRRAIVVVERLAIATALAIPLLVLPALAQTLKPDPGPEEPRVPEMMRMMREMHAEMHRMQAEMGRRGMGMEPMHERMGGMSRRMERMTEMMERHQRELGERCPAMKPAPKSDG